MITLYDDSVFPHGPHAGKTVKAVAQQKPQYLIFFQKNCGTHCISDEVMNNLSFSKTKPGNTGLLGTDSAGEE